MSPPITAESLAEEPKALRRGLGLYHPDLARRLRPGLREILRAGSDRPCLRRRMITTLRTAVTTLPDELSTAALVAFGIHPDTQNLTKLEERVDWLAQRLVRDMRTDRRRIDDASRMLAEVLAEGRTGRRGRGSSTGWYIERAQSVTLVDAEVPTAIERRVVVGERDGIGHLVLIRSIPRNGSAPPTISGEALFGGTLGMREWQSASRFQLVLELPTTLRIAGRHEYQVMWRRRPGVPVRPYYIFVPILRVDHFDLHVRFDREAPPARVWRVADAFHRDLDEEPLDGDVIPVDRSGEVHVMFDNFAPNHAYGARWA